MKNSLPFKISNSRFRLKQEAFGNYRQRLFASENFSRMKHHAALEKYLLTSEFIENEMSAFDFLPETEHLHKFILFISNLYWSDLSQYQKIAGKNRA